ncbi:hypothetical protein ACFRAQ_35970 [Nocardia sp. NPDC056611]|uniref:hypothetical protein n=1 Tax=Nocardia sp. NPDC056611 TaxID=3345877 RepID=UPI00366D3226
MTVRERLSDWWYYGHQRGVLMHCEGTFRWCVLDEIAHQWFRVPLNQDLVDDREDWLDEPDHWAYWICRKHDTAATRAHYRKLHRVRARRIRGLGWGR